MSARTSVLYGNRLYGQVLFENNDDPQFLVATLGDSSAMTDVEVLATGKLLAETESMSDLLVKLVALTLTEAESMSDAKVLLVQKLLAETQGSAEAFSIQLERIFAETMAMTEARVIAVSKAFVETVTLSEVFTIAFVITLVDQMAITDANVQILQIKGFSDFVLLKEWIAIKHIRPNPWTKDSQIPLSPTLFGRPLYAQKLYVATPIVTWVPPTVRNRAWTNSDGQNNQEA